MRVVALHGFTGRADAFTPVNDASLVSLPLVGHHPTVPASGATWAGEVARLAAALEAVGGGGGRGGPVHLVGYSLGARLALGVAVARPELVGRLTVAGVHPGLSSAADRAVRVQEDERWFRLLNDQGIEAFVAAWERLPLWSTQTEAERQAQRPVRLSHDPRELAGALRAVGLGVMPYLGDTDLAFDLLVGEHDAKFRALAATFRRARVHVIPGAGHNVFLENPQGSARVTR